MAAWVAAWWATGAAARPRGVPAHDSGDEASWPGDSRERQRRRRRQHLGVDSTGVSLVAMEFDAGESAPARLWASPQGSPLPGDDAAWIGTRPANTGAPDSRRHCLVLDCCGYILRRQYSACARDGGGLPQTPRPRKGEHVFTCALLDSLARARESAGFEGGGRLAWSMHVVFLPRQLASASSN